MINVLDFIRTTDLYKKFQVDDLLFVEFKCPYDDAKSGLWWHQNFFAFILGGETLLKTPQSELILKPGDCVFARKGSVLTLSQTQEDFCELLIFVPDDFIKTVIHKYKIPLSKESAASEPDTVIPLATDEALLIYLQSLLGYFSLSDPPAPALLKLKFEELIVHIVSSHHHQLLKGYFSELCKRSKPSIREIMEANFFSNLSLDEFARLCARSLSGFKREFLNLYHTTPGKWLMGKRLEYSKYLLQTTQMNIDEVCVESGFENRSHFIRVFKDKFGLTPGRFYTAEKTLPQKVNS
jgi:AraC-like DNA-binding protein